jgi:hypothetical protein
MIISLDGQWLIASDPDNTGIADRWWCESRDEALTTQVPWIVQDPFPGYYGAAWFWRTFEAPEHPYEQGRYLLRFHAVDYRATVWLNGVHIGSHDGGETPFTFDVTDAISRGAENALTVRVLSPGNDETDGLTLDDIPHRNRTVDFSGGNSIHLSGIIDSVELHLVPAVHIDDMFVQADHTDGTITAAVSIRNSVDTPTPVEIEAIVTPASEGGVIDRTITTETSIGVEHTSTLMLRVRTPHLWDTDDPFLYRVTVRITSEFGTDERTVRCGFREFSFQDGAFHLNGKRILLRGSHTGNHAPIGIELPHNPDLFRRDLVNVKAMGFNSIRFIAGMARRYQLDLCDEIGLLVYEETLAAWLLGDSDHMAQRFDDSLRGMILRDRNHPSIVIWGMLNETADGPVFRQAVKALEVARAYDKSRMVMLNSGRWDGDLSIGSYSNPGSDHWEYGMGYEAPDAETTATNGEGYFPKVGDVHLYPRVPHTDETIRRLRTLGEGGGPIFFSEYGIGSAVDLFRVTRFFEQLGKSNVLDAVYYRRMLDRFDADWQRWCLDEIWPDRADYFRQCVAKMAAQRRLGLDAIRANPLIVGHNITGTVDQGLTGEGLFTTFRELKPGTTDALFETLAPLHFCVFTDSVHIYTGQSVRVEVVLADEGVVAPGEYPIRIQILDPDRTRIYDETMSVRIDEAPGTGPLARPLFDENITIHGSTGRYSVHVSCLHGMAPTGGTAIIHATDAADMPPIETEIALWGDDPELDRWFESNNIPTKPYTVGERGTIIASGTPHDFSELHHGIAHGARVLFLTPKVLTVGDNQTAGIPKGYGIVMKEIRGWLYLKDEWTRAHPIFDGLPGPGLMDYGYYRDLIPDALFEVAEETATVIAGAIRSSQNYDSGSMVSLHNYGDGCFILNTLLIRENLGTDPAAERILRNMLRCLFVS